MEKLKTILEALRQCAKVPIFEAHPYNREVEQCAICNGVNGHKPDCILEEAIKAAEELSGKTDLDLAPWNSGPLPDPAKGGFVLVILKNGDVALLEPAGDHWGEDRVELGFTFYSQNEVDLWAYKEDLLNR